MRQESTIHIRLDSTLRWELEAIQKRKGLSKLSPVIREALHEYVLKNYTMSETKILMEEI